MVSQFSWELEKVRKGYSGTWARKGPGEARSCPKSVCWGEAVEGFRENPRLPSEVT